MDKSDCLDAGTLASFIDGRGDAQTRNVIEAHLASCGSCRRAWLLTEAVLNEVEPERREQAAPVAVRSKTPWWIGLGVAAAVVLGVVLWRPFGLAFTTDQRAERLVAALAQASATTRPSAGRLSGPFGWAEAPSATRSATTRTHSADVDVAAGQIRQLAASRRTARTLGALGVAHLVRGELDDAIKTLDDSLRMAPRVAELHVDTSAAYLDRFARDNRASDANQALSHADEALGIGGVESAARFNRAMALEALGLRDDAIRAWETVRDAEPGSGWAREATDHIDRLARRRSSLELEAVPLALPAMLDAAAADTPAAINRAIDAALDTWASEFIAGTPAPAPAWLTNAARALRSAGRDRLRSDLADAAAATGISADSRRCVAKLVQAHRLSETAFDESRYDVAADAARSAITTSACVGISPLPFEAQLAWVHYHGVKEMRSAGHAWAKGSVDAVLAGGYLRAAARMYMVVGLDALMYALISEAHDGYGQAREVARRAGDADLIATAESGLAETFRNSGDVERAWEHQRAAFALLPDLTPRRRHIVLNSAASTAQRATQASSLTFARLVVDDSKVSENPAFLTGGLLSLARGLAMLGRGAEADAAIAEARASATWITAKIEKQRFGAELDLVQALLLTPRAPREAVEKLTAARGALSVYRQPEVFLLRSRAHRSAGNLEAAKADLLEGIELFEAHRLAIADPQLRGLRLGDLWDLFGDLLDLTADDAKLSFTVSERSRQRALLDAMSPDKTAGGVLAPPYPSLPADVTVLAYAALPGSLLVWRVTRETVEVRRHDIGRASLEDLVIEYERAILEGRPSPSAARLAELLLPAGLPAGRDHRLVFLPDGPLYRLPFATLPYGGAPVVAGFVPLAAPSLSAMMLAAAPAGTLAARPLLIGFGAANAAKNLPSLPAIDEELDALLSILDETSPVVLRGVAATRSAILRELPAAALVHFAGHARADDAFPDRSRLFVAAEGGQDEITAADITALELRPDAVIVIEGCTTASGRVYRGEGAMTLARAFLLGGASTVVANFWDVNDRASTDLMTELYRRLADGQGAAAALAGTQRHAIARGEPMARWANLSVISKTAR